MPVYFVLVGPWWECPFKGHGTHTHFTADTNYGWWGCPFKAWHARHVLQWTITMGGEGVPLNDTADTS